MGAGELEVQRLLSEDVLSERHSPVPTGVFGVSFTYGLQMFIIFACVFIVRKLCVNMSFINTVLAKTAVCFKLAQCSMTRRFFVRTHLE